MDIKAEQKYILISPQKARRVVETIRGLGPALAAESLFLAGKKVAEPVRKVILQALANAKNKGVSENNLVFKEIQVGEGPRLKRGTPVSRGTWHPVTKRMSHIRVVLTTKVPAVEGEQTAPENKQDRVAAAGKSAVKTERSKDGTKS